MTYSVEIAREADGRWIADVDGLDGVVSYGATRDDALRSVEVLALRVIADRIEHGEMPASSPLSIRIEAP